jgi:hypothetical protein
MIETAQRKSQPPIINMASVGQGFEVCYTAALVTQGGKAVKMGSLEPLPYRQG